MVAIHYVYQLLAFYSWRLVFIFVEIRVFWQKHRAILQRLLEIFPGATAWAIILFPFWGTFLFPRIVAYFILAFDILWLYHSFASGFWGIAGYIKIRKSEKQNWESKFLKDKKDRAAWQKPVHAVIIVDYKEPIQTLTRCLESLKRQSLDRKQIAVVLAMEERDPTAKEISNQILDGFKNDFGYIFATFHPANLPGEVVGKAANEYWAAQEAKKVLISSGKHRLEEVTVTSCDTDSVFNKDYFAALNYQFLTDKNRFLKFWQAPIFLFNNLWRVPALIRIVSIIGGVLQLSDLQDPTKLSFNYSTYSVSLKLLDQVNYWDRDYIPEDWHLFLKSFFATGGKVEVSPIFLPIHQDAAESKGYFKALANRYEQCKRTAWGVVDIPYTIKEFVKHKEIPLFVRIPRLYKLIESHLMWSTGAFILAFGATIPPLINPVFAQTVLGQSLPKLSSFILTLCLSNLAVIIILNYKLHPPVEGRFARAKMYLKVLEWPFLPITSFLMSSIPGLHAQTKLMLGKYMEYRTTEKV